MSLSSKDELKKIYGIANDENKTLWEAAIHTAFPDGVPDSAEWSNIDTIIRVLSPFCAQDLNDTMLPQKG
jgi:hypothetical protein